MLMSNSDTAKLPSRIHTLAKSMPIVPRLRGIPDEDPQNQAETNHC